MVSPRKPLTDITSQVKKNAYFQTAVADPNSGSYSSSSFTSERYVEIGVAPQPDPKRPPPPIKIIVGGVPASQRTWYLPRALLVHHSTLIASILVGKPDRVITFTRHDPRDFSNFVDYLRSSIYSVNTQVSHYHALRTHVQSCLLGAALGCEDYCNAALRQLHGLFLPSASDERSCANDSCIRASDIAYICAQTPAFLPPYNLPPTDGDCLAGLRQLFFDAVASHWTQRDIVQTGLGDKHPDSENWQDVYHENLDFRATLIRTIQTWDGPLRSAFLKTVGSYTRFALKARVLNENNEVRKVEVGEQGEFGLRRGDGVGVRPSRPRPLPPIPGRRESGGRTTWWRNSADTGGVDLSDVRRQNEGRRSEDQAMADEEIAVWEDDQMES